MLELVMVLLVPVAYAVGALVGHYCGWRESSFQPLPFMRFHKFEDVDVDIR